MARRRVEIIAREELFRRLFFRFEEVRLRFETFSGTMSREVVRLNVLRGDGVAALLHDPQASKLILVEQFRYAAHENGPGWLMEVPAGISHDGEDPHAAMLREIEEETGFRLDKLEPITRVYLSPGGSSERIFLFYGVISIQDRTSQGGGLPHEDEDLRVAILDVAEVMQMIANGQIMDAKTLIALQWLQLNKDNPRS